MCVRTKTSYDCGHTHKQDESCHRQHCKGLERYHFENEGDCRQCKKGGETVSRGREGQGRYARALYKKELKSSVTRAPLSVITSNSQTSPWAPSSQQEKDWRSPIRRQADKAWEEEHARREEDLHSRSRNGSVRSDEQHFEDEQRRRDDREAAIREELRKLEDAERIRVRRRRERQASYDSFDSFGESYGSHSHAHYSHGSGFRSHESGKSRTYDSGFALSKPTAPYNVYNTGSYFRGLGQGFGDLVRDSGRRLARW